MIYYSKIVKIKMDYITKYQYVKLIHFLRRHQIYSDLVPKKQNNSETITFLKVNIH